MTPYLVDSHCHLNYKGLVEDLDAVIDRARGANVATMLAINTRIKEFDEVNSIAERYNDIFCTVGIHPHEAENEPDVAVEALTSRAQEPRVVGLGETGLDYYYDNAPREMQKVNFRNHIIAAQECGLPLVVHTRDAEDDTIAIMGQALKEAPFRAVIHCFTGSQRLADAMLEMGFTISLSGIVTFKSARDLQETARTIPDERLMVETDSPFLAPVPKRGKTCEPAYVAHTAAFLADLRDQPLDHLLTVTSRNFFSLFDKATPPAGREAGA